MKTTMYICPVCGRSLAEEERRFVCDRGHTFDRAREGYVNLLPPRARGNHGDNREMLDARRRFLDGGHYDPICRAVCEMAASVTGPGAVVLDEGCGDGFYTDRLQRALSEAYGPCDVYAFDISRDAVRLAARRNRHLSLCVAGAYHMPIGTGRVDLVTNLFSPLAAEETHRVLRTGAHFLMAIPDREHLFGLKRCLYDTPYENTVADTALDGFALVAEREVRYDMTLTDAQAMTDLWRMTPYGYRTPLAGAERLRACTRLATPVHVRLLLYRTVAALTHL